MRVNSGILLTACLVIVEAISLAARKIPTRSQLDARFYFDLGPAQINVSSYPAIQQENYKVFARACSQCHTLARPINSPIVATKDWQRYIRRMSARTKTAPANIKPFARSDIESILSFLDYDSRLRKIKHKAEFQAKTEKLKLLFQRMQTKRIKTERETDLKKARHTYPYSGPSPQP
ncbi:MAG: hypothetical protein ACYCPQ_09275 [Elusimicrobiota bacterium]